MNALTTFLQHLAASCTDDSFVRLALSSPVPGHAVTRVQVRLVELREGRRLSFTTREPRADTTRNLTLAEALLEVERLLPRTFRSATLATTAADWQLQHGSDGESRLIKHRPSQPELPSRDHDAKKPTLLGEPARPWLEALGILDAQGRPRRNLADKYTQIDRYAEILVHLARDCGFDAPAASPTPLRIADVGCGKGHLTFAAWHVGKRVLRRPVQVLGVETRPELVAAANATAAPLAGDELRFLRGDIADVALPELDVLIALHACNTATDHALRRGVQAGVPLLVVAPCCHQEVRPQLGSPAPLAPVLRHGLMQERIAEWATDGLRALVLEWAGYRTKVIEFVGSEHTAKNVMLAAVKRADPVAAAVRAEQRAAIDGFRRFFGIEHHALDALLATAG